MLLYKMFQAASFPASILLSVRWDEQDECTAGLARSQLERSNHTVIADGQAGVVECCAGIVRAHYWQSANSN